jgi:PAS domain S-box-containing protein
MIEDKSNMKRPTPIDKEVSWDKTQTIMSKTDKFGNIEYANETFIDVSGYEDYELMSHPHNIIRHPDMPKVIFKILWDNIRQGNEFHSIFKNLAKSGRYYWVITDFDYSRDDSGNIVHYFSRRKSVPAEIIAKYIEPLYKRLLQIEQASGVEASEKYLIGFLEEKRVSYVDYITQIMIDNQQSFSGGVTAAAAKPKKDVKAVKKETGDQKKGFFSSFFDL